MDGYLGALGSLPCTISPLNGLANTRDLAWPHRFLAIRRAAPGTKLFRSETKPRIGSVPPSRDQMSKTVRRIGRANAAYSRKVSVI